MEERITSALPTVLKWALMAGAILFVALYVIVAIARLRYPYELEWMEGGVVDHVQRLLDEKDIFVAPSLDFIPYTYTPLYYYVCAPVATSLGIGLFPLRLVSLVASLGCFLLIFGIVRKETRSNYCGVLSACLYAATYRASGAWFDIARPDSLFMLLLLGSIWFVRFHPNVGGLLAAGILVALSFLAKQTGLFVAAAISVYCLIALRGWRRFIFPATAVLAIGLSTLMLNGATDGWYAYYVFRLPSHHAIVPYRVASFWFFDMGQSLALACGLAVFWLIHLFLQRRIQDGLFYTILFGGMIGASWLVRMRTGSYTNTLIPGFAAVAIGFGLGVHVLLRLAADDDEDARESEHTSTWWKPTVVLLLCVAQFLAMVYEPQGQLPSAQDRAAGDALVARMAATKGDVFLPGHGYLPTLAGKKTHAHRVAIRDILRHEGSELSLSLQKEIQTAIKSRQFASIITDASWFADEMAGTYDCEGPVFDNDDVFWPVTGRPIRPTSVFVPKTTR